MSKLENLPTTASQVGGLQGEDLIYIVRIEGGVPIADLKGTINEIVNKIPAHVRGITALQVSNWNAAHGWGNHASAGYAGVGQLPTFAAGGGPQRPIERMTFDLGTGILSIQTADGITDIQTVI
jgi:hypothetical protein